VTTRDAERKREIKRGKEKKDIDTRQMMTEREIDRHKRQAERD